jgi:aspartate ammonia-lyase
VPPEQLDRLADLLTPVRYAADELLFTEGAPRRFVAVLTAGSVAIEKHAGTRTLRLATLGAGEAVGEGIFLDDTAHGTSARVVQPAEALLLSAEQVRWALDEAPALYAALVARAARTIANRLHAVDATLVGRGRPLGFGGSRTRVEHDLLGERELPDEALYGVQTLRAFENFPITGVPLRDFPSLIEAHAAVKEAAALANADLGLLPHAVCDLITQAARELAPGATTSTSSWT